MVVIVSGHRRQTERPLYRVEGVSEAEGFEVRKIPASQCCRVMLDISWPVGLYDLPVIIY